MLLLGAFICNDLGKTCLNTGVRSGNEIGAQYSKLFANGIRIRALCPKVCKGALVPPGRAHAPSTQYYEGGRRDPDGSRMALNANVRQYSSLSKGKPYDKAQRPAHITQSRKEQAGLGAPLHERAVGLDRLGLHPPHFSPELYRDRGPCDREDRQPDEDGLRDTFRP
jgi:hypothetical protein